MEGTSIDVLHKDPQRGRNMLKDPPNLPHSAKITLGTEKLRLDIAAIKDTKDY
jgi:hypothetical protein